MKLVKKKEAFCVFKLLYIMIILASLTALKLTLEYYNGYILKTELDVRYMLESLIYSLLISTTGFILFCKYT